MRILIIFITILIYGCDDNFLSSKMDIMGIPIKKLSIDDTFQCKKNKEGTNENKICKSDNETYYLKKFEVYYNLDHLRNKAILDFLDIKYPEIEIWVDDDNEIYVASNNYDGFKNIHNHADKKDYAIDIVLNEKQKIKYLTSLFLIGDLHTDNLGIVNNEMVLIDYDWAYHRTDQYFKYGYEFLIDYIDEWKYLTVTADELLKTGIELENILVNESQQFKKDLSNIYGFCSKKSLETTVKPYDIIYNNLLLVSKCLKSFSLWKPEHIITANNLKNSCLNPENIKFYKKDDNLYDTETQYFDKCYDLFKDEFQSLIVGK